MTAIFLQVRIHSTRLPGKALLPLPGGTVIRHAMRALKLIPAGIYALVTDKASTPELRESAAEEGFDLFTGPEKDVMERYLLAAEFYQASCLIRATGDNPLVSATLGQEILQVHRQSQADLSHFLGIPLGAGIEVVQAAALRKAAAATADPYEREHLTTYLYRHRHEFKVIEKQCTPPYFLPAARISLDTEDDYRLLRAIYRDLYRGQPIKIERIIQWFKTRRNQTFGCSRKPQEENSLHSQT